jgi:nucleoside-diphosphate-sugar epimerase
VHILVTGGAGVLGQAFVPLAEAEGHKVQAPGRAELDLFDPAQVGLAVRDVDAVLHLATRIQPLDKLGQPEAWTENDRLRAEASAILVDAALAADAETYVQPTVTFVYPAGQPASEETPVGDVPAILRSALTAERQAARFAAAARRGVVLRLGLLDGPGNRPRPAEPSARRDPAHAGRRPCAARRADRAQRRVQRVPGRRTGQQPALHRGHRLASAALNRRPRHAVTGG